MPKETLTCVAQATPTCRENDGKFTRDRVRGRKPTRCPKCKAADAPVPDGYGPTPAAKKKMADGRRTAKLKRAEGAVERVQTFLEWSAGVALYDYAVRNGSEALPVKPPVPLVMPNDADFNLAREVGAIDR